MKMSELCVHCEEEIQVGEEVYKVDSEFGEYVHCICFPDYAWCQLVGSSKVTFGEDDDMYPIGYIRYD